MFQTYTYDDDLNSDKLLSTNIDSNNLIESQASSRNNENGELSSASSVLLVHEVQFKHAGNYTCAPSNTRSTSINVHVLKGNFHPTKCINFIPLLIAWKQSAQLNMQ
jgi:hypothetical protein